MSVATRSAKASKTGQNPWTGVIGGLSGLGLCLWVILKEKQPGTWTPDHRQHALMWLTALGIFILMGFIDQVVLGGFRSNPSQYPPYHFKPGRLVRSAFWRYLAILGLLTLARFIYFHHPLYASDFYSPFRWIFPYIYAGYALLGLPYMLATLRYRAHFRSEFKDPGLHILLWTRALAGLSSRKAVRRSRAILKNRRSKIVLLGFAVELFFLPVMSVFMIGNFDGLSFEIGRVLSAPAGHEGHVALYWMLHNGMFLLDTLLVVGGYALPSRWLGNKIQSVEPTLLGWIVALMCYPPFNVTAGSLMPYRKGPESQIIHAHWALDFLMILSLIFLTLYVIPTLMFGTRFSNLTHRSILKRGIYAVVRHPAYLGKNLSWWADMIPYLGNPLNALFLLCWNGVYFLRAWTEERHLSRDPVYRDYCRSVPYRFIPGVF